MDGAALLSPGGDGRAAVRGGGAEMQGVADVLGESAATETARDVVSTERWRRRRRVTVHYVLLTRNRYNTK